MLPHLFLRELGGGAPDNLYACVRILGHKVKHIHMLIIMPHKFIIMSNFISHVYQLCEYTNIKDSRLIDVFTDED